LILVVILNGDDDDGSTTFIGQSQRSLMRAVAFELFVMQRFHSVQGTLVRGIADKQHDLEVCPHHVTAETAKITGSGFQPFQIPISVTYAHYNILTRIV